MVDKAVYQGKIFEVCKRRITYEREEYIEGMVAFSIPTKATSRDLQAAIWVVGLTRQVPNSSIQELTELPKGICEEIIHRLQYK